MYMLSLDAQLPVFRPQLIPCWLLDALGEVAATASSLRLGCQDLCQQCMRHQLCSRHGACF